MKNIEEAKIGYTALTEEDAKAIVGGGPTSDRSTNMCFLANCPYAGSHECPDCKRDPNKLCCKDFLK